MTTVSTERELFEAWAVTESFNIDRHYDDAGGEYHRATTRWAWMAWQAARSADTSGARWLPIEKAPKDGSLFLCWVMAIIYGETDEGQQYQQDVSQIDFCQWHAHDEAPDGGWFEPCCGHISDRQDVTHWMPLPEPPPAALGGPAEARRPDENSPSGPSDRALNPQPEAVDHDRGA